APAALLQATTVADAVALVEPAGPQGGADPDDPLVRDPLLETATRPLPDGLANELRGLDAAVASYRTVFGPSDPLAGVVSDLVLTAAAAELTSGERRAVLGAGRAALDAQLELIAAPQRQRFTLTAREGRVQLSLTNGTDRPVDVTLELRGDRLELPEYPDGRVQVRLEPGTRQIDLLLRARSSGDAPLDLRVTSPDGRLDLGRTSVTVRTTAVSGVGLVLMGAALLFLVVWWTRTILRDRRAARGRHPAHAK
ncbi:MAG: hypothetical protein H0W25_04560, partial [Acidimicrobiia bacterium]|nr:hypothetical protein [Acidimicrobiia bacterium]